MAPMRLPPEWVRIRGCLREAVSDIDHFEKLLARNEWMRASDWIDEVQKSLRQANGLVAAMTGREVRLVRGRSPRPTGRRSQSRMPG